MRQIWLPAFLLLVSGCASPYSAEGIPDLPGVQAEFIADDKVLIIVSPKFQSDCARRRDAILLKAAATALKSHYDHFEFVGPTETRYRDISALSKPEPSVIVHFCRGTCPGMFSADAIAHVLVRQFESGTDARSIWAYGKADSFSPLSCPVENRRMK